MPSFHKHIRFGQSLRLLPFILLLGGAVTGCGKSGFQNVNGKPALVVQNASVGRETRYIAGADPSTFKALNNAKGVQATYAADASRVYIAYWNRAMPVELADPATFTILTTDGAYTADKQRVFWFGVELAGADPATFRVAKSPCAVDSQRAYIGIEPLELYSVEDFEVLQMNGFDPPIENKSGKLMTRDRDEAYVVSWSRDGTAYYWGATELEGADYDSLVLLGDWYAKDNATVYFEGVPMPRADAESFQVIGPAGYSARDERYEYEGGKRVVKTKQ